MADARLIKSPYETDGGEMIGEDPRKLSAEFLLSFDYEKSPIKAIRAKCLDCAENESEVRKCVATDCPLWPLRMGKNVFHSKREMTDEQRAAAADRLAKARSLT